MYEDIKDDTVLEITKIFDIHIKNQKHLHCTSGIKLSLLVQKATLV